MELVHHDQVKRVDIAWRGRGRWRRGWRVGRRLVAQGARGQKTRAGFFRKTGKEVHVLDPGARDYRPSTGTVDPAVAEILALKHPGEKLARLRAHAHPQAQFLWAIFRDLFHYCAVHLAAIADNARDVDLALRWGFGWTAGPFETWQAAGWKDVAGWLAEDIAAGKTLASAPLPAWVGQGPAAVDAARLRAAALPRSGAGRAVARRHDDHGDAGGAALAPG